MNKSSLEVEAVAGLRESRWPRRVSRRLFLAGALLGGAAAILAACGGGAAPTSPSGAGPAAPGSPASAAGKPAGATGGSAANGATGGSAANGATGGSGPAGSAAARPAGSAAASAAARPAASGLERVSYATSPGLSSAQTYVGVGRGYFRDAGIDLDIQPQGSGTDVLPQLATSKIDIAHTNINAGTYNALTRGLPLKFVADGGHDEKGRGYTAMVVRKALVDSGKVKNPPDLKGLKIGVFNKGSTVDMTTQMILATAKLQPSDVTFQYTSFDESVVALGNNAIDAAVLVEPYVTASVEKGFTARMWGASDLIGTMQTTMVNFSPDFAAKRQDTGNRFMEAYLKGSRDYMDAVTQGKDWDAIVAMLTKPTGISDPALFKKMTLIVNNLNGEPDIESLKTQQKWYADHGFVQTVTPLDPFFDRSFLDHALAVVGKR
jgi:NitT/TauT family transport system substrate-binding protein